MIQIQNKSQFWAISAEGMNRLLSVSVPAEAKDTLASVEANNPEKVKFYREILSGYINQRQEMSIEDGIAKIHLYGPMISDASPLDLALGSTSYEEIREDLAAANANPDVKGIILVSNTTGGTVAGIEETYIDIKNSSKPVFAYNEGYATSAGYYLLAAAEVIAASPSSTTGNIGTVLDLWDYSGYFEKIGVKREVLTNEGADLKGTMRGPLQENEREFLQNQINAMGQMFKERVLENRADVDDEVFRAGWYQPDDAAALGLIDYKGSLSEFTALVKNRVDIGTE